MNESSTDDAGRRATLDESDDAILARVVAEIGDRVERGETVDQEWYCHKHPEYAARLRSLWPVLAAVGGQGESESPKGIAIDRPRGSTDGSDVLGDFRLLRVIGRGGMGIVYEAYQKSLRRKVALKVLTAAGAMDPRQIQRFQVEVQAAAALHHPNIVAVFSVGCDRGIHHYAMELIEGRSLADLIAELRQIDGLDPIDSSSVHGSSQEPTLDTILQQIDAMQSSEVAVTLRVTPDHHAERDGYKKKMPSGSPLSSRSRAHCRATAALGIQAAQALEHAHQNGVLHRDIKPSNLLIDREGKLCVADFGLARIRGDSRLTQTGDLVGTLRYMGPEQVLGRRDLIDERADVYALGATLYELLTLRPAFAGDNRAGLIGRIGREEPMALRRINAAIPADLETIILKAMAKEPLDRYPAARELADDLGRYLSGEPIRARPPSVSARVRSSVKRHRTLATAGGVTALAAAVIIALAAWSSVRQRGLVDQIATRKTRETQERKALEEAGRKSVALKREDRRLARIGFVQQIQQTLKMHQVGQVTLAKDNLREIEGDGTGYSPREFAWKHARNLVEPAQSLVPIEPIGQLTGKCIPSPDGATLAVYGARSDSQGNQWPIYLVDRASLRVRAIAQTPVIDEDGFNCDYLDYNGTPFSPDGSRLIAWRRDPTVPGRPYRIWIWGVQSGRLRTEIPLSSDRRVRRCNLLQGNRLSVFSYPASQKHDQVGTVELWETRPDGTEPKVVATVPQAVYEMHYSPDGRTVPLGVWVPDRRVQGSNGCRVSLMLLDAATGKVAANRVYPEPDAGDYLDVGSTSSFSLDEKALAIVASDRHANHYIIHCDIATGRILKRQSVGKVPAITEGFVLDSNASTAAVIDHRAGTITLWERKNDRPHAIEAGGVDRDRRFILCAFSRDGAVMVVGAETAHKSSLTLWDVASGTKLGTSPEVSSCHGVTFTPDGRDVVLSCGRSAMIWRLDAFKPTSLAGHRGETRAVAFSADGVFLATAGGDGNAQATIKIWHLASAREKREWGGGEGAINKLTFSPDGRLLATAHRAERDNVRLWDVATGSLAAFPGHAHEARAVAFSPDGSLLASSGDDGVVRLWNVEQGSRREVLKVWHEGPIGAVAFSPDCKLLASGGEDGVRLWDVGAGNERAALAAMKVRAVSFSADGGTLEIVDTGGMITSWDISASTITAMTQERSTISGADDELKALAFVPEGSTIAAAGMSGKVRLFDTLTGQELLALDGNVELIRGLAFSPDGSSIAACCGDGSIKVWRSGW